MSERAGFHSGEGFAGQHPSRRGRVLGQCSVSTSAVDEHFVERGRARPGGGDDSAATRRVEDQHAALERQQATHDFAADAAEADDADGSRAALRISGERHREPPLAAREDR